MLTKRPCYQNGGGGSNTAGDIDAVRFSFASGNISATDYFTLSCQTATSANAVVITTFPTCTGNCQYSANVLTAGYGINNVKSTWTYIPMASTGTGYPPPPLVVRF